MTRRHRHRQHARRVRYLEHRGDGLRDSGERRLPARKSRQPAETVWKIQINSACNQMLPPGCRQLRASSPRSPERRQSDPEFCARRIYD